MVEVASFVTVSLPPPSEILPTIEPDDVLLTVSALLEPVIFSGGPPEFAIRLLSLFTVSDPADVMSPLMVDPAKLLTASTPADVMLPRIWEEGPLLLNVLTWLPLVAPKSTLPTIRCGHELK